MNFRGKGKMYSVSIMVLAVFLLAGCSPIEMGKTLWGSSTRVLEKERTNAIAKSYNKSYWDVMRASFVVFKKQGYEVLMKDEVRGYVVLVGIKGSVNTTEVGVFFVETGEAQTRIELSSLSTNAKRIASKAMFHGLDIAFGLVPPDPEEKEDPKEAQAP